MRVRTGRFRSGDQGCPPSHDAARWPHPRHPMLPIRVLRPFHSPIRGHRGRLRLSGRVPADRFSPSRQSRLPVSSFQRAFPHPRLALALLWRLLTSQGISSPGSPQIRACCFPARPPHLPTRLNQWASLCCASSPRHVGLLCDFCPSAHQFPLAFLSPLGYPHEVGLT